MAEADSLPLPTVSEPSLRVLIDRLRCLALVPAFWEEANRRLRANGLPSAKFQKNPAKPILVHPSLGKELCILCWAVEEASLEDIKQGVSQIRNPVIARVFRELELVEEWGSGIPGIFRIAKEENLPESTIEELAGRVRFTVPLVEILPLTREQSRRGGEQSAPVTAPVSDYVEKLLHLPAHREPPGNEDIREAFGLKSRRRLRETYLAPALSAGLIQYTLPEKPHSRLQKYRLTDAGRKMTGEG